MVVVTFETYAAKLIILGLISGPQRLGRMANRGNEEDEVEVEDVIFVAVGKDVKEGKSVLLWALKNSGGKKICILHVHEPAQRIPFSKFLIWVYGCNHEQRRYEHKQTPQHLCDPDSKRNLEN